MTLDAAGKDSAKPDESIAALPNTQVQPRLCKVPNARAHRGHINIESSEHNYMYTFVYSTVSIVRPLTVNLLCKRILRLQEIEYVQICRSEVS